MRFNNRHYFCREELHDYKASLNSLERYNEAERRMGKLWKNIFGMLNG